jgi:restriction system protein
MLSRAVIDSDKSRKDKLTELYGLIDTRKTAQIVLNSVVEGAKNYKNSDLPLAVKAAVPMTLLAVPFIGGHGVGITALGGAIGLPALLVMFLGAAGITSVIEALVGDARARTYLAGIFELIARDEVLRHIRAAMKNGTQGQPREPVRAEMPEDEHQIREKLLATSPSDFESHVMSFFQGAGLDAAPTQQGADGGIDGFAKHSDGRLIVVQCKRFAADNIVGRPDIHRFWGALEENEARQGYFVTTSRFTQHPANSAKLSKKIILVDLDGLVGWHKADPVF